MRFDLTAAASTRVPAAPPAQFDRADLPFYRQHTLLLLRRYFRLSIEVGRLPALLGREIFRARLSVRRAPTFEDAVIFVHDVERCLARLDPFSRELIARIVFQEYSQEETAALLHVPQRSVERNFPVALDDVSAIFLSVGILRPLVRPD